MKTPAASLVTHLIELRNRLLFCIATLIGALLLLFPFSNDIYSFVAAPLQAFLPEKSSMIATAVATPFLAPFKLTFFVSFLVSTPVIFYQIWAFLAPGLYENEKKLIFPLILSSVILFYAGITFAYYLVFPLVFSFFTAVGPADVTIMTDIGSYLDFVLKLFFAFGIAFEIPVATILLIRSGTITVESITSKRPYIIVAFFIIGMLLTPPDVISQVLLAVPMWMLFECGIGFSKYLNKPAEVNKT